MIFSVIWFVFTVFGSGALVAGLLFLWTGGQLGEVSGKLTPQQAELHLAELEKQRQQEEEAQERQQREVRLDRLQQQNEALQEEITRKQEERRQQRVLTKRFGEATLEAPAPTPEPLHKRAASAASGRPLAASTRRRRCRARPCHW